jgi:DNA primase
MGIADEDIALVRDRSDIVAVVSDYTQLKRVGRNWQGLCPFHTEKSGSFSVNQEQGLYHCFGCGVSGDVITFLREIEHLDFVGAVEKLAARAGIVLHYTDQGQSESRRQRARVVDAVRQAVDWYHQRLLDAPDAAPARRYLRSRGLGGDEVRQYQLGWAPEGWDVAAKALSLPGDLFVESGLGFRNRNNRLTDAFRGRVLFPIFDANGDPVAFGGRVLPGSTDPAKYKNSTGTAVYDKSRVLYALNWSKAGIVAADEAIVCEGYTDVIGFASAGLPRAVATCGTALTEEHFRLLRSYARRVVLAFDADAAGQNAAARFYEWERQYEIDVAVAALPAGVDPADLARSDPDALVQAVAGAVPFLGFRVERVLAGASLNTPEGRARAAEQALAVIAEHPNELVRDQYLMEVASRTRIDPDRLRADLARPRRPAPAGAGPGGRRRRDARRDEGRADDGDPGPGGAWAGSQGRLVANVPDPTGEGGADGAPIRSQRPPVRESAELEALRLLVRRPEEIAEWLNEVLFDDDRARAAWQALRDHDTVRDAIDASDEEVAHLLARLAVEDTDAEVDDVIDLLLLQAAGRELDAFKATARLDDDPDAFARCARDTAWVKLLTEQLRESGTRRDAREQLLTWLTQEPEEQE